MGPKILMIWSMFHDLGFFLALYIIFLLETSFNSHRRWLVGYIQQHSGRLIPNWNFQWWSLKFGPKPPRIIKTQDKPMELQHKDY